MVVQPVAWRRHTCLCQPKCSSPPPASAHGTGVYATCHACPSQGRTLAANWRRGHVSARRKHHTSQAAEASQCAETWVRARTAMHAHAMRKLCNVSTGSFTAFTACGAVSPMTRMVRGTYHKGEVPSLRPFRITARRARRDQLPKSLDSLRGWLAQHQATEGSIPTVCTRSGPADQYFPAWLPECRSS